MHLRIKVLLILLVLNKFCLAQKMTLDSAAIVNWKTLGIPVLSENGNYVYYQINYNSPVYPINKSEQLVIQSTKSNWTFILSSVKEGTKYAFVNDSREIAALTDDTLRIIKLGTNKLQLIPNVIDFKININDHSSFIAYQKSNTDKEMVFQNLRNNHITKLQNVNDYSFSSNGKQLIWISVEASSPNTAEEIHWRNLSSNRELVIWRGNNARNFVWNEKCSKLVFLGENDNGSKLYIFDPLLITVASVSITASEQWKEKYDIAQLLKISDDGKRLYINLKEKQLPKQKVTGVMVDVWNYLDTKLQSVQALMPPAQSSYKGYIDLTSGNITQLEFNHENSPNFKEGYFITSKMEADGDLNERSWNPLTKNTLTLVNTYSGDRKILDSSTKLNYKMSPGQKFAIYFNYEDNNFYTYEIATGKRKNISSTIDTDWHFYGNGLTSSKYSAYSPAAWLPQDQFVIISDQFDLWQIDPKAEKAPINLTNGYGRRNHISFRLIKSSNDNVISSPNGKIYLSAFSQLRKQNGFFFLEINKRANPTCLVFTDNVYYFKELFLGLEPIKALNANAYIIRREDASHSPNYFYTEDFIHLKSITNHYPERKFNWLKTELHWMRTSNQDTIAGILYKPEDFDSSKKYPLIFNFYESKSHFLNKYIAPDFAVGDINVPWYVSRGYLVFTPDMKKKPGYTGEYALNSILAAIDYLKQFSYIDQERMGIQGTSFGGYEANYIVSHTNKFAAAMSSVGVSNLTSLHGSIDIQTGQSYQEFLEQGQVNMELPLWEDPKRYISNSPIFSANQIQTPLLLESNKGDTRVDYLQGLQMFLALRRMGKKAWMLQYDEGNHDVQGIVAIDYTKRMTQFFDHYLMNKPAPIWMTRGIPFTEKGINSGFKLDSLKK